jgi:hypothetical protein
VRIIPLIFSIFYQVLIRIIYIELRLLETTHLRLRLSLVRSEGLTNRNKKGPNAGALKPKKIAKYYARRLSRENLWWAKKEVAYSTWLTWFIESMPKRQECIFPIPIIETNILRQS